MPDRSLRSSPLLIAGVLLFASLVLYTATLAPSVVTLFDDSLEFQLVTYQLGIAHPTGYPLYTLLGHLFTYAPIGNIAYRINWMSAVFGAATVALLYLFTWRLVGPAGERRQGSGWATHGGAAIGAMLLAVGPVFWQQATIAEVYSLNAFFVAALLLLAVSIPPCQSRRSLLWLAFLAGLSLTHHRTMLLLFPALALYLLTSCRRVALFKLKTILLAILCGLLPLLLYLYLPLRGHIGSLDGAYQNSWSGFWQQVTASGYGSFIFGNPFDYDRPALFYWNLLADQFYTTVPGLIGLAYLVRFRRWNNLALTGIAFVTYFAFNIFYNVTDIEVFFIPVFLLWAAWSGIGAAFLLRTVATVRHTVWRYGLTGLLLAIFIVILVQVTRPALQTINQTYTWTVHDYGIDILQQPLEEESTIVGILGEMTLLRYFQQTEGLRPDIETIAADREDIRLATVERLLTLGQSVYLTRPLPGAAEQWSLTAVGPLIQVRSTPQREPPIILSNILNQSVTPEIKLVGYTISRTPHTGPGPAPVRITLYWQALAPIAAELKVSVRLLNPNDSVQAVVDAAPVHFAYPTSAWRSGEIVSDVYDLVLPVETTVDQYRPLVIVYDPAQGAAEVGRLELMPVLVD